MIKHQGQRVQSKKMFWPYCCFFTVRENRDCREKFEIAKGINLIADFFKQLIDHFSWNQLIAVLDQSINYDVIVFTKINFLQLQSLPIKNERTGKTIQQSDISFSFFKQNKTRRDVQNLRLYVFWKQQCSTDAVTNNN